MMTLVGAAKCSLWRAQVQYVPEPYAILIAIASK